MCDAYVREADRGAVASIMVPFTWPEITSGAEAVAWSEWERSSKISESE